MKALTVWQPWASLIAIRAKPYEFRGWKPPKDLIGQRIAIHASARPVKRREVMDLLSALRTGASPTPCLIKPQAEKMLEAILNSLEQSPDTLFGTSAAFVAPLSCVVCTAIIGAPKRGDQCAREFGEKAGNDSDRAGTFNWGWPILDVQPVVPPMPARGAQGLWNVFGLELHERTAE